MGDAAKRIKPAPTKQPGPVNRSVDKGGKPQFADQRGHLVPDPIECCVRDDRHSGGRHRCDIMIENLQGIGMQIDKVAWDMDRDQLTQSAAIVDVARHKPFDEVCALFEPLAGTHDCLTRRERSHLGDGRFKRSALFRSQVDAAPVF
jgi:hypothetical protein